MQKVRFLQDFGEFKKDTYRVIIGEDETCYHVQFDLHSYDTMPIHKSKNSISFQVIERS